MLRQALPLILLTRPAAASARFAARVQAEVPGAEVLISPLQAVRPLEWTRPPAEPEALIFTSQSAVAAAAKAGLSGLAYCVGDQTAEAAAGAGFRAVSASGDSAALADLILAGAHRRLWHLRGALVAGDLAGTLRREGCEVAELVVYATEALDPTGAALAALTGTRPIVLPLFSPQGARRAVLALGGYTAPLSVLAISPATAQAAAGLTAQLRLTARRPDATAMLEIVAAALKSGAMP